MFKKWWFMLPLLAFIALMAGCSGDKQVTEVDIPAVFDEMPSDSSMVEPQGFCDWWMNLGQAGRNNKIVVEALYSVDQQIWDQNDRVTCRWDPEYLNGYNGCYVPSDWDYSIRETRPDDRDGWGGQCKPFAQEVLSRASGYRVTLPGGTYDYTPWFPYRNRIDGINHAQPGEVMQWTNGRLHTAIIISNLGGGRFEVVDSNVIGGERIGKHVIDVRPNTGLYWSYGDLKFYVINRCL